MKMSARTRVGYSLAQGAMRHCGTIRPHTGGIKSSGRKIYKQRNYPPAHGRDVAVSLSHYLLMELSARTRAGYYEVAV